MAELHNEFLLDCSSASILLADSQLCILGRASPNKGSTSSHKREYPEMASYKIHTAEYLFFSVVSSVQDSHTNFLLQTSDTLCDIDQHDVVYIHV